MGNLCSELCYKNYNNHNPNPNNNNNNNAKECVGRNGSGNGCSKCKCGYNKENVIQDIFHKNRDKDNYQNNNGECILCLEKIDITDKKPPKCSKKGCTIEMHLECIQRWFLKSNKCPICNEIWIWDNYTNSNDPLSLNHIKERIKKYHKNQNIRERSISM